MLNVNLPEKKLRALRSKNGVWHPLAYITLTREMNAQGAGLRSSNPQSVAEYFSFAFVAIEFLKCHPRGARIRALKEGIARETTAIENAASGTDDTEERKLMMRAVRVLRTHAEQLTNAPS